jgi:diacylglycerol kinase (ATP)
LPFGLKPFGAPREGLKLLDVDAPPRRLLKALPMVLNGKDEPALLRVWATAAATRSRSAWAAARRSCWTARSIEGGELTIGLGPSLRFLVG